MNVTVRCPVFPTENPDIISESLLFLFPNSTFVLRDGEREKWFEANLTESTSLEKLRSLIHDIRIIDAVRRLVRSSWTGTMFNFKLDKQAAVRRKVNSVDESEEPPLGAIEITVSCESQGEYESLLQWFVPPTRNGKILKD